MTAIALTDEQLASAKAVALQIGARIRHARQSRRETIEQLALRHNMHPTTVCRIEAGAFHNVKLGSAIKLLNAYNLTLEVRPIE